MDRKREDGQERMGPDKMGEERRGLERMGEDRRCRCGCPLEWEPDALLIPEHRTVPGGWYCLNGCDQCVCPCGREKADDEPLCGRCYDEEHGPDDEVRFSNCDRPTDFERYRMGADR